MTFCRAAPRLLAGSDAKWSRRFARGIFDTKRYYDRVFGELRHGEVLEWYNSDWEALAPALAPFLIGEGRETASTLPARLLDLGCGTSRLPAQLARVTSARIVVGVDVSPEGIRVQKDARRAAGSTAMEERIGASALGGRRPGRGKLHFVEADACSGLPFRSDAFGAVIEKGFVDALCSTARGKARLPPALQESWRVLAPGGVFISVSQTPGCRRTYFEEMNLEPSPASLDVCNVALPGGDIRCYVLAKPVRQPTSM